MTTQVLKAVLAGILAGIAIFMLPFLLIRVLIFFLLIRLAFRLFSGRGRWRGRGPGFWRNPAYANRWHSMSPEERKIFMDKMEKELFAQQNPGSSNI